MRNDFRAAGTSSGLIRGNSLARSSSPDSARRLAALKTAATITPTITRIRTGLGIRSLIIKGPYLKESAREAPGIRSGAFRLLPTQCLDLAAQPLNLGLDRATVGLDRATVGFILSECLLDLLAGWQPTAGPGVVES